MKTSDKKKAFLFTGSDNDNEPGDLVKTYEKGWCVMEVAKVYIYKLLPLAEN